MHDAEGNRRPSDPPLCSPKSICYLARKVPNLSPEDAFLRTDIHQLGLESLEAIAYEDIVAKTSVSNVVRESFSKSTAR